MELLSFFNHGAKCLLCKIVLHSFIEIGNQSKRNPNKLWVDQGREFYSSSMQKCSMLSFSLDYNDILMYLTHNEGKPVVAERFIKTLKSKICKKMTAAHSKSYLRYLNKLVDK